MLLQTLPGRELLQILSGCEIEDFRTRKALDLCHCRQVQPFMPYTLSRRRFLSPHSFSWTFNFRSLATSSPSGKKRILSCLSSPVSATPGPSGKKRIPSCLPFPLLSDERNTFLLSGACYFRSVRKETSSFKPFFLGTPFLSTLRKSPRTPWLFIRGGKLLRS